MRLASIHTAGILLALSAPALGAFDQARAAGGTGHPPEDMKLHFDFYSHWKRKVDGGSCCNDKDCYPTVAHYDPNEGVWYARRREDGRWLRVPKYVYDPMFDSSVSPDGRPHLCAHAPDFNKKTFYFGASSDVICFTPAEAS